MATKTSTKKTYEVPNKSGGYTTVTSTSKAGAVSQVGSSANLRSGGSSSSQDNTVKYDALTGKLLAPGASTTDALGNTFKQGSQFSLDTSKPVQSDKLGQPQIPVAPAPTAPNYEGTVTQALGTVTPIEPTEQSIQQSATDRFDKFLASQKEAPNLIDIQNKLEKQNQIQAKQEKVNTYQSQLNSIVAKAQADVLGTQGQGRGIPEAIIGGQQAQINKEAAIQALPIQALLSSAQGDLQTAQAHVDKLFGIYAQDAENQVKFFNDQSKLVYDFATKQEQQQLDRLNEQKKFEQNILVSKMDAQQKYAQQALSDGNITLFNRLTSIQPPTDVNSPSYQQDLTSYEQKVNNAVAKYGTVASSGGRGGQLTPAQINTTVNSIAGAFDNEPSVKEYNTIKRQVNTFNSLGNSATDDIQRVYSFAKIADPTSAVKEGEYNSIEKYSQALMQRAGLKVSRVFSATGILTPEARQAMSKTLQSSLNSAKATYDQVSSEYQRQINDTYSGKPRQITDYAGGVTPTAETNKESDVFDEIVSKPSGYWSKLWSSLLGN